MARDGDFGTPKRRRWREMVTASYFPSMMLTDGCWMEIGISRNQDAMCSRRRRFVFRQGSRGIVCTT
jgi:hypothetical protein